MDRNFQQVLLEELLEFLQPLSLIGQDPETVFDFFHQIGWDIESQLGSGATNLVAAMGNTIDAANSINALINDPPEDLQALVSVLSNTREVIDSLRSLSDMGSGISIDVSELPGDILNALTLIYLHKKSRLAFYLLEFLTLIRDHPEQPVTGTGGAIIRIKDRVPKLELDRLAVLFTDPGTAFGEVYWPDGFTDATITNEVAGRLFPKLQQVFAEIGIVSLSGRGTGPEELPADVEDRLKRMLTLNWEFFHTDEGDEAQIGASFGLMPQTEGGPGVFIVPFGELVFTERLGDWIGQATAQLSPEGFQITESGFDIYSSGDTSVHIQLMFQPSRTEPGPAFLIGSTTGTRLEVGNFSIQGDFHYGNGQAEIKLQLALHKAAVVVTPGDGDGFLQSILSEDGGRAEFDLKLGWSNLDGFSIEGSGALEIRLPVHVAIGPIEFNQVTLRAGFEDATVPVSVGGDIKAALGPLKAVVENMGMQVTLTFPGDGGNLGPLNIEPAFKPPNGVGLSIDAGVVKGGGYLYFDFDNERYAGALELVFSEFLTLKAIGLITTRMPDGSKGFSLLVIITAEFGSPIQLGFGFTLSGVGGLVGLNRTMRLQPLAEGVRTGAVNSVMFPTDVVANAPRIISDLRNFFPPHEGIFLIGPMAKLGWGTPNLVTLSMGIIIEIPGNIAILGVLKVVLPDEKAALLVLQVNFIGAIEFDKKRAWFFASLFESRVLFITIEGEMGILVAWGNDANFVVSVGGFHPAFKPPPLPFPNPKRIAVNILNTSVAKIRVEGYFAVTSNTVQFGARAELFFGLSAFKIEGHIAFDALFQFSPFYMIIEISASLSVKVFGIGLFSVRMRGSLEGPTPWHVEGTGSISLLFFDIDVDFSKTWGEEQDTTLPPIEVMPLLKAEFEKLENWKAKVPAANKILVSLRELEGDEGLVLHPVGTLEVSQRAVPLDLTLDKVGAQKPSDANIFTLSISGGGLARKGEKDESFAMAQFKTMSDSKKLSAPAYEPQAGGLELSVDGEQLKSGFAVKRVVRYEQIIIDSNYKRFVRTFFNFFGVLFKLFLNGNAATRCALSNRYKQQKQPFADKIVTRPGIYAVAVNSDNSAFSAEAAAFTSKARAEEFMQQQIKGNPELADALHVIPQTELKDAA